VRRLGLAVPANQTHLFHLGQGVDMDACLFAGAFVELSKVGLPRNFPQQIVMGEAGENTAKSRIQNVSQGDQLYSATTSPDSI